MVKSETKARFVDNTASSFSTIALVLHLTWTCIPGFLCTLYPLPLKYEVEAKFEIDDSNENRNNRLYFSLFPSEQERMCVRIGLKDIWCLKEAYYAEILQNWDLLETLTEED